MKTFRLVTSALTTLTLLFGVSVLTAVAAEPENTFPGGATYIDNQTHSIAANTSLWYRFDYAGDRSQITITLVNRSAMGLAFDVFTPAQIGGWWDTAPIGRGTPQPLNCDTGQPQLYGACQSDDLIWNGNFNAGGTYYVQVVNTNSSAVPAQLMIQGSGVVLSQ